MLSNPLGLIENYNEILLGGFITLKRGKKLTLNQRKKLLNGGIDHINDDTVDDYLYVKREITKPDNDEVITFINRKTKKSIKVYNDNDMYIPIPSKEEIGSLKSVSLCVNEAIRSFNHDFQDRCLQGDMIKENIDQVIILSCTDNTITDTINKTRFPDEAVLRIIQNEMGVPDIQSIHEFSSIEAKWFTCPTYMGYKFYIKFKDHITETCIEIEVNKEGEFL